ncbi:MAG: PAS domain-containing protein, partial [Balneolales bacterium]
MESKTRKFSGKYFPENGEAASLIRRHNWAGSPLGPIEGWPHTLYSSVTLCLESSTPIIIYCTGDFILLYNDAMASLIGKKHPFALGKTAVEVFPEILESISPTLNHVFLTGKAVETKCKSLPFVRNGSVKAAYCDFTYNPIRNDQGEIIAIFTMATGITGPRQAETELATAKSEAETDRELLARVFQKAPSFMCILQGPDHVIERANDRYLQLVGNRTILGKPVREALPEIEEQGFFELLDQVYRTGETYTGTDREILIQSGSDRPGEKHYLTFVYQPIRDPDGSVTGIFVQGVDLTRRKEAEIALARLTAESEQQKRLYETIISSTPDLVYVFDLNYRFTFVNDALLNMWGRSLEESIGKSLLEVGYEPWHAEMHEREIEQIVSSRKPIRGEVPFQHATLGRRIYDYILVPVFNSEGEVETIAGTTRDITEHKQAEETQRLLIGELNHRVKNMLSTIQSITQQTLKNSISLDDFVGSFTGRLHALSRAHSLLTKTKWGDAYMDDIVREQLAIDEKDDRVAYHGPQVCFSSHVALYLAMVLHELGTNA